MIKKNNDLQICGKKNDDLQRCGKKNDDLQRCGKIILIMNEWVEIV
jgi:hypothetical protein